MVIFFVGVVCLFFEWTVEKHLAAKSENTGSGLVYAEFVIPDIFDFSTSFLIFFLVLSYFRIWVQPNY